MKNYSETIRNALRNPEGHCFCHVISMELVGASLLLTDADIPIVHAGQTYLANALINQLSDVKQEQELAAINYSIQFTAADQTMLALFLNNEQRNRVVRISRVLLADGANTTLGTLFTGRYRVASFATDGENISVSLRGALVDLLAVKGIVTTHESVRRAYPDNTSFINSSSINDKIKWGGK